MIQLKKVEWLVQWKEFVKSIARYNKIAEDQKIAEYYLLGILLSTICVLK